MGMVAPTGNCVADSWQSVLAARSGVARISAFDPSQLPVQIAGEVKGFDAAAVMGAKESRQSSRFVQLTMGAAHEALTASGLADDRASDRRGCCVGVGSGGYGEIEQQALALHRKGTRRVSPLHMPYAVPNMASARLASRYGLLGPSLGVTTACASGSHAMAASSLLIANGLADVMVTGGVEGMLCPLSMAAFASMHALSRNNDQPARASRPFDLHRDGFVMAEGAGVLVLEALPHALQRGAEVLAELVGCGMSTDGGHITSPDPEGKALARAMTLALQNGQIPRDEVDYINAHGTSTPANDSAESAAIMRAFGSHASQLSISSTKGVTGHCLGAAGAIEAIFTILALRDQVAPPTANYQTPDPACPLDYTPNEPRERRIRYALSNSSGFGGQNACVAFRRFEM
jgi:3-oxoacyl-[acyl-carrier-protein] synthase II